MLRRLSTLLRRQEEPRDLRSAVADLDDADLAQLEDELDFYAYTNHAGPLLTRLMPLTEA